MSVKLSVEFKEDKVGMMVLSRVQGDGLETPEEMNRAIAMAKAISAIVKEVYGGETVMEKLNDERVREVMAQHYQNCGNEVH